MTCKCNRQLQSIEIQMLSGVPIDDATLTTLKTRQRRQNQTLNRKKKTKTTGSKATLKWQTVVTERKWHDSVCIIFLG